MQLPFEKIHFLLPNQGDQQEKHVIPRGVQTGVRDLIVQMFQRIISLHGCVDRDSMAALLLKNCTEGN